MYNRGFLHAPWQGMVGPYNRQLLEWFVENVLLPLHIFFFSLSPPPPHFIRLAHLNRAYRFYPNNPAFFESCLRAECREFTATIFSLYKELYRYTGKHYTKGKDDATPQGDRTSLLLYPCYYTLIFLRKENSIIICLFSLTTPCYNVE